MKLEIDLRIIFVCLAYCVFNNLNLYLLFLIFITIHELIHMTIGIILGFSPEKIEVRPLGLSLTFYSFSESNELKKILVYLAGPIANLLLAYVFYQININSYCIYINLALGIFNLLPIMPLDGGKILKEILKIRKGKIQAYRHTMLIGTVCLIFLTFTYSIAIIKIKNIWILLTIIYLWHLKIMEDKKANLIIRTYNTINQTDT